MPWTPDSAFDHLVSVAITHRREAMAEKQKREYEALDGNLSSRGVLNSGMRITGRYKIDSDAFDEFGQGVISDVLDLFRDVHGSVPAEAVPWIKTKLEEWLDGLANGLAEQSAVLRREMHVGGQVEPHTGPLMKAKRRLMLELGKIELRANLKTLTPPDGPPPDRLRNGVHVFICHVSEDKADVARPLATALTERGYRVWLDETELKVGDRLLDKIDEGIQNCRFGVVILSPNFFTKRKWNRVELAALVARQIAEERPIILPVWFNIDETAIAEHLPTLAGILAAKMDAGLGQVVDDIVRAVGSP